MLLVSYSEEPEPAAGRAGSASLPARSRMVVPAGSASAGRCARRSELWPTETLYRNSSVVVPDPPEYVAFAGYGRLTLSGRTGEPATSTASLNATAIGTSSPGEYAAGDGDDVTLTTRGPVMSIAGKSAAASDKGSARAAPGFGSATTTAPLSDIERGRADDRSSVSPATSKVK